MSVPPFEREFEANLRAPWEVITVQGYMDEDVNAALLQPLNIRRQNPEHRERLVRLERQDREMRRGIGEECEENNIDDPNPELKQDEKQ